jgi:DNA polymerase III alpha subunit (gram-positive type)
LQAYIDIYVSGLSSEIIQLAAACGEEQFSCYVLPTTPVQDQASRITGMTFDGTTLYKLGLPLQAVSLDECLTSFHQWLLNIHKPILLAHNCRKFDSIILCHAISKCKFHLLSECIHGFCDTLPMLKDHISTTFTSYSLENLVKNVLGCSYGAHDAVEDCKYLQKLVEHFSIDTYYLDYTFSASYIMDVIKQMEITKSNLESLMPLIRSKVVSDSMGKKIASSGLSLHHLHLAYERKGYDGIFGIFTECFEGKVRVTKHKKIITAVTNFLKER